MKFAVMVEGKLGFNNSPTRFHGTFEAAKEQAIAICKKRGMKTYILKAIAEVEFKVTDLDIPLECQCGAPINSKHSCTYNDYKGME